MGNHLLVLHYAGEAPALVGAAHRLSLEDAGGLIGVLVPARFPNAVSTRTTRAVPPSGHRRAIEL